ncbi:helix-turn-helix domain-containing protein [Candidatus Saganbacteria bacterium]|nr:helix-turn-helix domain-containing protein [Candidatus Saganbacteria bacterium]
MLVDEKEIYTPQEVISILKVSDSTFRRLVRKGILRAGKIGGQYRVLGKHILQLLNPELPEEVKKTYKNIISKI